MLTNLSLKTPLFNLTELKSEMATIIAKYIGYQNDIKLDRKNRKNFSGLNKH